MPTDPNQSNLQEAHTILADAIRWADNEMFRGLSAQLCRARALIAESLSQQQSASETESDLRTMAEHQRRREMYPVADEVLVGWGEPTAVPTPPRKRTARKPAGKRA